MAFASTLRGKPSDLPEKKPYTDAQNKWMTERKTHFEKIGSMRGNDVNGAINLCGKALSVDRQMFGPVHREVAITLDLLARLYYQQSEYLAAAKAQQEIVDIIVGLMGEKDWRVREAIVTRNRYFGVSQLNEDLRNVFVQATHHHTSSSTLFDQLKSAEALTEALQAVPLYEKTLGKDHDLYAQTLSLIGRCQSRLGRYDKAQESLEASATLSAKLFGRDSIPFANAQRDLAILAYNKRGETLREEQSLREALAVFERDGPPLQFARTLKDLGVTYQLRGEKSRAVEYYEKSQPQLLELQGADSAAYLDLSLRLIEVKTGIIPWGEIEKSVRELLPLLQASKNLSALDRETLTARATLTLADSLLRSSGKENEVLSLVAAVDRQTTNAINKPLSMDLLSRAAAAHRQLKQYAAAETALRKCIDYWSASQGAQGPRVKTEFIYYQQNAFEWAKENYANGRPAEAKQVLENRSHLSQTIYGERHPYTIARRAEAGMLETYGALTVEQRQRSDELEDEYKALEPVYSQEAYSKTARWYARAIPVREELYGAVDLHRALWLAEYSRLLKVGGQSAEAQEQMNQAADTYEKIFGWENPPAEYVAPVLLTEAWLLWDRREFDQAAAKLMHARRLWQQSGTRPDASLEVDLLLVRCLMEMGEFDRADVQLRELQTEYTRSAGPASEQAANILGIRYIHLMRQGKAAEAKAVYEQAFAILGPESIKNPAIRLRIYKGAMESDATSLDWGRGIFEHKFVNDPEAHTWRLAVLDGAARFLFAAKDPSAAENMAREALEVQRRVNPENEASCEREVLFLSQIFERREMSEIAAKQLGQAEQLLTTQLEFWSGQFGQEHWRTRTARNRLQTIQKVKALDAASQEQFSKAYLTFDQLHAPMFYPGAKPPSQTYAQLLAECEPLVGKDCERCEIMRQQTVRELFAQNQIQQAFDVAYGMVENAERLTGKESELAMVGLSIMVDLLDKKGDRLAADKTLLECCRVLRKIHGRHSPSSGPLYLGFGRRAMLTGNLHWADQYLRQAHMYYSTIQHAAPEQFAMCLAWYGLCTSRLGNGARAKMLLDQGLELAGRLEKQQPIVKAVVLRMRGEHFVNLKDYGAAEQAYREAVELFRRVLGEKSDDYLDSLLQVANILRDKGDDLIPGQIYQQVLDAFTARWGTDSLGVANVLQNRARFSARQGNFAQARADLERSETIRSRNHQMGMVELWADQADLAMQENNLERAKERSKYTFISLYESMTKNAAAQNEHQQLALSRKLDEALNRVLSVDSSADAYYASIAWKGTVYIRQMYWRKFRSSPLFKSLMKDWERVTGQLATLALHLPYPEDRELWVERVMELTVERDRIERNMTAVVGAGWGILPKVETLQSALPDQTALVDYVEYIQRSPRPDQPGKWNEERRLTAFVIRKAAPVQRIELGKADEIRNALIQWLGKINPEDPRKLLTLEEIAKAGREVKQLVWNPIQQSLGDIKTVLVSPDGLLSRAPFAALPGATDDTFLIEERSLVTVTVPSLLPELLAAPKTAAKGGLLALGDADFGGNPALSDSRQVLRKNSDGSRSWLPFGFPPLDNTGPEVDAIEGQFEANFPQQASVVLKKLDCSEENLRKEAPQARWLHIATHGFYSPDLLNLILQGRNNLSPEENPAQQPRVELHPGILCGLALAGASFPRRFEEDDGILSGLEVSAFDLSRVDLAVLSACESALGQEATGEGQLGLQRAFQMAGARSVIATLWPVNDAGTRLLMMRFYRNLWKDKMGKLDALHDAQTWLITSARKARQTGANPETVDIDSKELPPVLMHPQFWAPFTLSGRWD